MLLTRHKLLLFGIVWFAAAILALAGMVVYAAFGTPLPPLPATEAALAYKPAPTPIQQPAGNPAAAENLATSTSTSSPARFTPTGTAPASTTGTATETPLSIAASPTETGAAAAVDTSTELPTTTPTQSSVSSTSIPTASATHQPASSTLVTPPTATQATATPTTTQPVLSPTPTHTTPPPTATATSVPPTPGPTPGPVPIASFWGINGGPIDGNASASPYDGDLSYSPGLRAKSFFWMNQAGIRWFRNYGSDSINYSWRFVEPSSGQYDWSAWDTLVRAAQQKDVGLLASIGNSVPQWANGSGDWHQKPTDLYTNPMNTTAWYQYVYHVVERYDGDGVNDMPGLTHPVRLWELWNEPDLREFWNGPNYPAHQFNGNVNDYVRLSQVGYAAVKAADPSAVVVGPSSSQIIGNTQRGNMYLWNWQDWMNAGGLKYVDIVAFHAYLDTNNWDTSGLIDGVLNQLDASRGGKPAWVTEIGWDGSPTSDYQNKDNNFVRSVVIFWQRPAITRYFWYNLQESETHDGSHQKAFLQTLNGGAAKGTEPDPLFHPIFRVSQVMARVLAGFGSGYHPSTVNVGGAARAYHFSRSGVDVWVAWQRADGGNTTINLDIGGRTVRVIGLYGQDLGTFGGGSLSVGAAPVYLTTQLDWITSLGTIAGRVSHGGQAGNWSDGATGTTVSLAGPVNVTAATDSDGNYVFENLPDGAYVVSVAGGSPASQSVTVAPESAWGRTSFTVP